MLRFTSVLVALYTVSASPAVELRAGEQTLTTRPFDSNFQPQIYHDFGAKWNPPMFCPTGTYASGFRQKTDLGCAGGLECSGLNGIELMCSSEGGQKQLGWAKTEIDVPLGQNVNWRANHWCPEGHFLYSAQLLVQPDRGFFEDDDAIEGVNFQCDDGSHAYADSSEMKRRNGDNWMAFTSCPVGQVICGVRAAGEWEMFDNVALDKLAFACCTKA